MFLVVGVLGVLGAALALSPLPYEELGVQHVNAQVRHLGWPAAGAEVRRLNRDVTLLSLPLSLAFVIVGYGLLRLRPWARKLSAVIVLVVASGAIAAPWLPVQHAALAGVFHALGSSPAPPPPIEVKVMGSVFLLALSTPLLWFGRYLSRRDIGQLFSHAAQGAR